MSRTSGFLVGVVGVLAGVLGTLGAQHFSGGTTYLEDIAGYKDAQQTARYYCAASGAGDTYDPKFLTCVEDRTRSQLVEDGHPEADTAPVKRAG